MGFRQIFKFILLTFMGFGKEVLSVKTSLVHFQSTFSLCDRDCVILIVLCWVSGLSMLNSLCGLYWPDQATKLSNGVCVNEETKEEHTYIAY